MNPMGVLIHFLSKILFMIEWTYGFFIFVWRYATPTSFLQAKKMLLISKCDKQFTTVAGNRLPGNGDRELIKDVFETYEMFHQ